MVYSISMTSNFSRNVFERDAGKVLFNGDKNSQNKEKIEGKLQIFVQTICQNLSEMLKFFVRHRMPDI